jgi:hypothetical protein
MKCTIPISDDDLHPIYNPVWTKKETVLDEISHLAAFHFITIIGYIVVIKSLFAFTIRGSKNVNYVFAR